MATIHDEIDNWLAADIHGELSDDERGALHTHLVECAACRKAHQENKIMNKLLEETLANEKPDPAFEQRMLSGFRSRIPQRSGLVKLLGDLMRLRATQITAVAAVLLGLVQVGRMITGEGAAVSRDRGRVVEEPFATQPSQPRALRRSQSGALSKSDASSDRQDLALEKPAPPPRPDTQSKFQEVDQARPTTVAPPRTEQAAEPETQEFAASDENLSRAEEPQQNLIESPPAALANRKLIRNATSNWRSSALTTAVQKITALANEESGYVATSSSEKQANGKLRGQVVVKVLPENLDRFLQKVRALGELKNQTLGTEDVTKAYFDTEARLKNARVMEQRLIEMLKTKTGKVADLLQVEKELGRVREEIEKMQGELKYWDSQVQFATVTISLVGERHGGAGGVPAQGARSAGPLRAGSREDLQRHQSARVAKGADHQCAARSRLFRTRFGAREYVDRAGRKRCCDRSRERIWTRREFPGADRTHRARRESGSGGRRMRRPSATKWNSISPYRARNRNKRFSKRSLRIRASSVDEKAKQLREFDREAKRPGPQFDLQSRSRWAGDGECVAARADEKLFGAHAIAELSRQSRRCKRAPAGSHWRTDRRGKRAGGHLDPGLQPGQHRFIRDRLVRHAATHPGAKRQRHHVEFPHDRRCGGVSRALGDRDCRGDLDHEAGNSRTAI